MNSKSFISIIVNGLLSVVPVKETLYNSAHAAILVAKMQISLYRRKSWGGKAAV